MALANVFVMLLPVMLRPVIVPHTVVFTLSMRIFSLVVIITQRPLDLVTAQVVAMLPGRGRCRQDQATRGKAQDKDRKQSFCVHGVSPFMFVCALVITHSQATPTFLNAN